MDIKTDRGQEKKGKQIVIMSKKNPIREMRCLLILEQVLEIVPLLCRSHFVDLDIIDE